MNLTSLYYFTELAKTLHITNTAQRLYISQQNLSQHIQRLEQNYGIELFHRKPRLSLTFAGEQLYTFAVKVLEEEAKLNDSLNEITFAGRGNLKIGIPGYRGQVCLPDILPRFYEKWPNVSIQLVDTSSEAMEQMLFDGELDMYIGIKYTDDSRLEILPLLDDKVFLIVSDALMEKHFGALTEQKKRDFIQGVPISEFGDFPFLLLKHPMRLRKTIDECFLDAGIKPNIYLESTTTELLISLYPHDYGVFFCTQMRLPTLKQHAPTANAFPLMLHENTLQHHLVLARHKDRFLFHYGKDFIEITREVHRQISSIRTTDDA